MKCPTAESHLKYFPDSKPRKLDDSLFTLCSWLIKKRCCHAQGSAARQRAGPVAEARNIQHPSIASSAGEDHVSHEAQAAPGSLQVSSNTDAAEGMSLLRDGGMLSQTILFRPVSVFQPFSRSLSFHAAGIRTCRCPSRHDKHAQQESHWS